MLATEKFTLRISPEERKMLAELAKVLRRSQSDAIRYVVCETLKVFKQEDTGKPRKQPSKNN
jgi:hypothetical protein